MSPSASAHSAAEPLNGTSRTRSSPGRRMAMASSGECDAAHRRRSVNIAASVTTRRWIGRCSVQRSPDPLLADRRSDEVGESPPGIRHDVGEGRVLDRLPPQCRPRSAARRRLAMLGEPRHQLRRPRPFEARRVARSIDDVERAEHSHHERPLRFHEHRRGRRPWPQWRLRRLPRQRLQPHERRPGFVEQPGEVIAHRSRHHARLELEPDRLDAPRTLAGLDPPRRVRHAVGRHDGETASWWRRPARGAPPPARGERLRRRRSPPAPTLRLRCEAAMRRSCLPASGRRVPARRARPLGRSPYRGPVRTRSIRSPVVGHDRRRPRRGARSHRTVTGRSNRPSPAGDRRPTRRPPRSSPGRTTRGRRTHRQPPAGRSGPVLDSGTPRIADPAAISLSRHRARQRPRARPGDRELGRRQWGSPSRWRSTRPSSWATTTTSRADCDVAARCA